MNFKKTSILLLIAIGCFSIYAEVLSLSMTKDDNQQKIYGTYFERDDWEYCQVWVTCPGTAGCRVFVSGERDDCPPSWDYCSPRWMNCRADDGGITCEILCDQI